MRAKCMTVWLSASLGYLEQNENFPQRKSCGFRVAYRVTRNNHHVWKLKKGKLVTNLPSRKRSL